MTLKLSFPLLGVLPGGADATIYQDLASDVVVGRAFRQPLSGNDATAVIDGLELWMRGESAVAMLYACCDGELQFVPGPPAALWLTPNVNTQWTMGSAFAAVEARPQRFGYINVDTSSL